MHPSGPPVGGWSEGERRMLSAALYYMTCQYSNVPGFWKNFKPLLSHLPTSFRGAAAGWG
jgi:hypothetical protein